MVNKVALFVGKGSLEEPEVVFFMDGIGKEREEKGEGNGYFLLLK